MKIGESDLAGPRIDVAQPCIAFVVQCAICSGLTDRQGVPGIFLPERSSTQTHRPSDPTPTLSLPLKGREIAVFLPLQGGGQEGDGVSVGVVVVAFLIDQLYVDPSLLDHRLRCPLFRQFPYCIQPLYFNITSPDIYCSYGRYSYRIRYYSPFPMSVLGFPLLRQDQRSTCLLLPCR